MRSEKNGSILLLLLLVVGVVVPQGSHGRTDPSFKLKSVNLGGWLDGTQIQLKSVTTGKFVCAELGGGSIMVANRTAASGWETFKLWRINQNTFNFRVFFNQFVGLGSADGIPNRAVSVATTPSNSESFQIVRHINDTNRIKIRASNGIFLQAKTDSVLTADYSGNGGWGDDNPSVFLMTIVSTMQGEYQITNGYGPIMAPRVMRNHWSTFIVEDDFKFISQNGINGVRIPVGWWIASDPNPPKPYVGGSLIALDNAFAWALKYNIKVIIDLHAAPASQNGFEHSGSRDSVQAWGTTDANIQQTTGVIDFLAASLKKYYQMGYDAVRNHTQTAYVILSNRLSSPDPQELFTLASGMQNVVIDVHYYNLFSSQFNSMTPQQNIDFVNNNRASDLGQVTTSNGPLTFVGEWVAEWAVQGASKTDYQNFANAQLQVYGKATFGWAYWTLKNVNNHWSLQWMITNGYITLVLAVSTAEIRFAFVQELKMLYEIFRAD
ncbi:hypothetical protein V2J09_002927 [Rumex salicifolius]